MNPLLPVEKLKKWCKDFEIEVSERAFESFQQYAAFLVEYNEKVNLTAITEPEEIALKHFLDSLLVLKAYPLPQGAKLVDVGTGAGFPGVPLKIVRPDLALTLLDSMNKRIVFLKELTALLGMEADAVHCRAEEGGQGPLREQYDIVTARAVAGLNVLCEYCLPLVRVGGVFLALKARGLEEELEAAKAAVFVLGAQIESVQTYTLPDSSDRSIVVIRKISQTPSNYPRPSAKMAKKPL